MKKIVNFAMVLVAILAMGCTKPGYNGSPFLDVTPNNISGVWRMESYDDGVKLAEGSYYYIVFDRAERTFVSYDNLGIIPQQFARMGIRFEQRGDDIYIPTQESYSIESFIDGSIMTIADAPWPGLTPDLLSIFLVVATQAKGSVLIHQKMFESRLFFVDKLIDMGAQIILCDPHRATVIGLDHRLPLRAANMTSPDIRAGVALLIAAMSAEGTSTIQNVEQIDRGYRDIDNRLNALGAKIIRLDE